eukprot:2242164-Pleurochrysis_carterae.AAC.1
MAATDAVHRRAASTGPNVSHAAGSAMREKPPCVFPSACARISSHYSQCADTAGGACSCTLHIDRHITPSPVFTASRSTAHDANDILTRHCPAYIGSDTLLARARVLVTRHNEAFRFICTLCLVGC